MRKLASIQTRARAISTYESNPDQTLYQSRLSGPLAHPRPGGAGADPELSVTGAEASAYL
jgi:hypothetical protein